MNGNSRTHCMVVHAYYPLGETRVERQALALIRSGYRVDVICLRKEGDKKYEIVDGAHVHRLPVARNKSHGPLFQLLEYLRFFIFAALKLVRLHTRHRYGVVQIHNLPDFLVFAGFWPKIFGARLILDIHDLMPEFYAASFGRSLASWPVRLVTLQEQISCKFANHVITVTDPWRNTLVERGVPRSKCSVVMNVADDRLFNRAARSTRKTAPRDGQFQLIYHGSLTSRYGVDVLIRAVNSLREELPGLRLLIHGGGPARAGLERLAEELRLTDRVKFSTTFVPTRDLPALIAQGDVGVVPYLRDVFTDGILPTKLMEYAALGIPVIASRTPAIQAYFDEDMVQYFTPGDHGELAGCIVKLHQAGKRRAELAANAEEFNRRYNWEILAPQYVTLVEELSRRAVKPEAICTPQSHLNR